MSRIPVYNLPDYRDHTEEQTGALIARAYSLTAEAAGALDAAINGSMEFVRQNVRRPQGMLTRQANGAIRRADAAVRAAADQLDARVANTSAEIAGALRGFKGIADVVRTINGAAAPTMPPIPAAPTMRGPNDARAFYQTAPTPDAGGMASGMLPQSGALGGGSGELGGEVLPRYSIGDTGAVPQDVIVPAAESQTGTGAAPAAGSAGYVPAAEESAYQWLNELKPAPEALHPDLRREADLPAQRQRQDQAPCCPPPPVVNVTVQPARVDLSQLAAFLDRLPWRQFHLDAFPQAPPTGGTETPGFDPSQIGDVAEDENGLPFHGEGGTLSDPAEQALAAARAIALALSFIR